MTNIDPNTIGNALYFILTKKEPYSKYTSIYSSDQSLGKSIVPNLIVEVYNKYFKLQVNLNTQSKSNVFILQGGDVIKTGSGNTYLITHSEGIVGTWPKLTDIDSLEINSTIKQYEVIRPNFDNIKETLLEDLQNIGKEILSTDSETNRLLEQIPETLNNSKDIKSADGVDFYSLGEGALQIGDLIFIVDPTQLAFNSQNGYQYFPTLRTQGNPKIPTTQQVKNLSINLIFPNEDSINYQLLNLYAMFKRTPFVNIRNKDICEFFKDICFMEEWLPVALESIQIQSVPGFPNTLQASITILPFDYRMMSDGFQALLSMEDVERQQTILYRNEEYDRLIRKAESKLDEQSVSEERFLDVLIHDIDKSPDFRNSLPFRAFYQSLIADRKFIMNSSGKIVSTSKKGSYDIAWFRPTKTENLLNEYKASSNNKSITLSYNYISKDFQTFSKIVSNERTDKQVRLLKQLTDFYNSIRTKDDLIKEMVTFFTRKEDFYNITEGKFQELSNNIIPNLVTRFGITMEGQDSVVINNWFDLLTKGFAIKQGWTQTIESIQSINNFFGGNFSVDNTDVLGFLNGVTYTDKDTFGIGTFQWGIKKIWDWIDTGTDKEKELKKKNFSAFLGELRSAITKELTSETLVVNPTADGELFSIARIPIVSEDIVIDNISDIIVGWSIIFSNKFIPMTLQAYKYPYYQHIGSEDTVMSLNITSIYNKNKDLKSQLSILSERLHESAKVVTLNAPELITYLDPRITINAEANNLFNSFGIKKVVFDSFNIVNIDGQPNSWNIAVNFTQSNFTISDYHGISHVPSNEIAILELAKIVSSIEKVNDNYVVIDYKTRSGNLLNLNDILKIRFLSWSVSNTDQKYNIIEYIKQVKSGKQSKNTGTIGTELADKYLQEFYKSIGSLESFSLSQPNTTENFNVREVNITKTKILQDLIENSQYKRILDFINIKTEELFKLKSELIRSLVFNDKSWFRNYLDRYDARYKVNPILLPYVIAIFDTIELEQKNRITSKLSPIFNSMEESFSSMVSIDFADKILRDPVVYKKIITPEIIGETQYNNIERYKKLSRVNCYNDFDIPNFSDTVVLGPDFYLYNNIADISENRYYISESLKRYAKIGKLGAMMSLVESTDALTKYDQIISQLESIEPEVKEAVSLSLADDIPGYTSDANIKEIIAKLKNIQNQISLCNNSIDEISTISDDNQQLLDKFKNDFDNGLYPGMKKEEFDTAYKIMESKVSKLKSGITVENIDFKKINLIHSARTMTMLEIFEIYSVLNNYIIDEISSKNNIFQMKPTKLDDQGLTKSSSEKEVAQKLYNYVRFVLINNKNITTSSLESGGTFSSDVSTEKSFKSEIRKQFSAGGISDSANKTLSLPNLRNIQNYLFNKIGYYIRLNSFIVEYGKSNSIGKIDLTNLPELSYLDFWNFRSIEENDRKIKIIKEFSENQDNKKDTTIKMYPTFKLFFVEEDKNFITHNFDDYYTQNAIQSIEIVSNKNSASKTARIILSNVTNSLTDQMSLLRESEDLFGNSIGTDVKAKNLFLGTLDVKPGTQIIIKMGYAPYDNLLTTVFHGRIIEMNPGSMVEMICQDFASQLNHKVVSEKFGVASTVKDYGDIASATLDMIPGLEKLGKESKFNIINTDNFTGRNLRNIGSNFANRYLMSNLFGSLSALNAAKDNPRDENIYLNYSAVNTVYHKPTFDWIIYDQTVWSVLQELCLYNRDKIATIRTYNEDPMSSNNNLRETIVVGDKAGYYKCTDSFALSSLNIKELDKFASDWDTVKNLILNNKYNSAYWEVTREVASLNEGEVFIYKRLNKSGIQLYSFIQNKLNSLVLIAHLLDTYKLNSSQYVFDQLLTSLTENKFFKDDFKEMIYNIYNFNKNYYINIDQLNSTIFESSTKQVINFEKIINSLRKYIKDVQFVKESYYNVKDTSSNIDQKYLNDPQYKKIQKHHLITDSSDIISNNISLNSSFSNVVNVYYTNEPSINTASLDSLSPDKIKTSVNMWSVKAFGDQKDEFSRILNSYQKNIDTNWFDVSNTLASFYGKFQRIKGQESLKKYKSLQNFELPRWDLFPSFVLVGVRLLQKEVERMYQGTIEIVGNPKIQPYDIIHLQDYTNDMHGVVEVEEVIHSFTPERGYRTIITPNLIMYDRDPIQLQDIQIINQIYDFSNVRRNVAHVANIATAGMFSIVSMLGLAAGGIGGTVTAIGAGLPALGFLYNGTVGAVVKQQKFLYDQLGHILGRDCINFTSLLYHGMPFMTGFDGVDYTNLKTLMNHKVADVKNPINRFLSFGDTFDANIITNWNPEEYGIIQSIFGKLPITSDIASYQNSGLRTGFTE